MSRAILSPSSVRPGDPHSAVLGAGITFDQPALCKPGEDVGDIGAVNPCIAGDGDLVGTGMIEQRRHHRILDRRNAVLGAFLQKDRDVNLVQASDQIAGTFP